ncbi:class I SAM-dependent methyltransferase [Nafulsella turpanensis]|uniref:class I SAM-dependent methyltransferase n=1 Tax=Nafulsella turpanensis TaxID=1265690 RepID=UPI00034A9557|nr:class I SAM-dependent methyltransferase [Nafulsella turpanensis]
MENSEAQGHSEDYFGGYRDFWWNKDFLDLMAERLRLKQHHSLLDVGCGLCHWSRLLTPYLAENPDIYAVDNDPKWSVEDPEVKEDFRKLGARFSLQAADARTLPFEDDFFDMVTCQTVLIHIKNPALAIAEMKRVLKPGGTILCVEPNNRVQSLIKSSLSADDSVEETLEHVKYALIYEKGKKKRGEGDNSLGDLLPGMLAEAGFRDIEVRLSDKAIAMYPPYAKPEQEATLQQWARVSGDAADDEVYFKSAGRGYLAFYEMYRRKYAHLGERMAEAIENHSYHAGGGTIMYLISGTK